MDFKRDKTVYVAMSGGVDSSVAAALLQKREFKVVGVFFKPWSPPSIINGQISSGNNCQWQQDRLDAMRVAAILGIPFKTWDFSRQYGLKVANYMIEGYRRGITPNPDVMCNKEIKFGLFLKKALTEGADYIATGHYVRKKIDRRNNLMVTKTIKLLKAKDRNKDQSYFLWTLTQTQLKHCLFPIGGYTKPEVRSLARKFGLPNHDKKDSQGVCFVGELDMKNFLTNYIKPKAGEIKLIDNHKTIGRHEGAYYYTLGQRHGLSISNGQGPYYVVAKEIRKNIVYVAKMPNANSSVKIAEINWVGQKPKLPGRAEVKIRYRSQSIPAMIVKNGGNGADKNLLIKFLKPAKAVAPGQSAVFYRGQIVLGGGIII